MKKNYLVIETIRILSNGDKKEYIHFINLREHLRDDVASLFNHLSIFEGQIVKKVCFSEDSLSD